MNVRELTKEEYNKIRPLIKETSYGLKNHSIFNTYEDAVNCNKPISLNGSPYKGRKNKGTTHIKDIVKLPDGKFGLVSKTLCMDAGIAFDSGYVITNTNRIINEINPQSSVDKRSENDRSEEYFNDNVITRSNITKTKVENVNINFHTSLFWVVLILIVMLFLLSLIR